MAAPILVSGLINIETTLRTAIIFAGHKLRAASASDGFLTPTELHSLQP